MSDEENNDLGDEAKKTGQEFAEGAKEAAGNIADELGKVGGENKKLIAGLLAIFLGSLGIHKFILGYQKEGFILLGFSVVSYVLICLIIGAFLIYIPMLIGLIEGIIYLTKSDEEFYNTYQVGKKPWF